MTGTGSGKTESFLLPILGKLAREAETEPERFFATQLPSCAHPLSDERTGQRPTRTVAFAVRRSPHRRPFQKLGRASSRVSRATPAARLTQASGHAKRIPSSSRPSTNSMSKSAAGAGPVSDEQQAGQSLLHELKARGKWPAKPDLLAWFGDKGTDWQDRKTGAFRRAVTLPGDVELLTRHEVQVAPPDLLVTNYSMLEYMLMRPIERPIFDQTRDWLERQSGGEVPDRPRRSAPLPRRGRRRGRSALQTSARPAEYSARALAGHLCDCEL